MRVFPYLVGLYVSLLAGPAIGWLSGSVGFGMVASVIVLLVAAYLIWARREFGDETNAERFHARDAAANAGVYHSGHSGGFDGEGGFGGGCDGGGGGSC